MNIEGKNSKNQALAILSTLFFMWGLITVVNFMLVETFSVIFSLSLSESYFLNVFFFGAYFVVSYPAAFLIDRVGYKKSMVLGVILGAFGCLVFCPAAAYQSYPLLLVALFILGSGITILQVSANPYVALIGLRGDGASKLTLLQAFNSLGTFLAPLLAAGFFMKIAGLTKSSLSSMAQEEQIQALIGYVQMPYLLLGIGFIMVALLIGFSEIPTLDTSSLEPLIIDTNPPRKYSLQTPHVWMAVVGIFLYVGTEVAIGQYLVSKVSTLGIQSNYVKIYWGGAMVGRFVGFYLLRYLSPRKSLALFSSLALLLVLSFIIFGDSVIGLGSLSMVGMANSILFPCLFALGIDGMGRKSENSSAALNMAIAGGAILPYLFFSLPSYSAFVIPFLAYGFIIFYGLKGSRYKKRTNFY